MREKFTWENDKHLDLGWVASVVPESHTVVERTAFTKLCTLSKKTHKNSLFVLIERKTSEMLSSRLQAAQLMVVNHGLRMAILSPL